MAADNLSSTCEQPSPPPPRYFRPEGLGFTHEQLLHAAFGGKWSLQTLTGFGPDGLGGILVFVSDSGRLATFSLNTQLGELAWRAGVEGDAAPASCYIPPLRAALGEIITAAGTATDYNWQAVVQRIAQLADAGLVYTADLTT